MVWQNTSSLPFEPVEQEVPFIIARDPDTSAFMLASATLFRWQTLIIVRASGEKNIISMVRLKICVGLLLGPESVIFFFMDLVSHNLLKIHCTFPFATMIKLTITNVFLLH